MVPSLVMLALLVDAPPCREADLLRLPSAAAAAEQLRCNRACVDYWRAEPPGWKRDGMLDRLDQLARPWESLGDARRYLRWADEAAAAGDGDGCCADWCRDELRHLRRRIGDAAYLAGEMPPALPPARVLP